MALKRPHAISFSKKNAVRPFEDAASIEFWANKNDASMFVVGQSTKKRPNGLTFVRTFDSRVLDMCELGVEEFKGMDFFKVCLSICAVSICIRSDGGFLSMWSPVNQVDTRPSSVDALRIGTLRHTSALHPIEVHAARLLW